MDEKRNGERRNKANVIETDLRDRERKRAGNHEKVEPEMGMPSWGIQLAGDGHV